MFTIQHITVDCHEPYALAEFWSAVTGWPVSARDEPGDHEVAVEPADPGVPDSGRRACARILRFARISRRPLKQGPLQ